jgi:ubiquinone/menaquinone biosynthesis C-methylase UbiE
MWSETIGYRQYRKPYLPQFFAAVAEAIPLNGQEDLLDLGCGAGEVALGFAPYVARLTGMDLEDPMLTEAARKAQAIGCKLRLIHSRVEDAPAQLGRFDLITMGRAHWYLHTPESLHQFDQWLKPEGHILVCRPLQNPDGAEWREVFMATRARWARDELKPLRQLSEDQFFHGTPFAPFKRVTVHGEQQLQLEHLIFRALGTPSTTRARLGADAEKMIAAQRAAMAPYFLNGPITEQLSTLGVLYSRAAAPAGG